MSGSRSRVDKTNARYSGGGDRTTVSESLIEPDLLLPAARDCNITGCATTCAADIVIGNYKLIAAPVILSVKTITSGIYRFAAMTSGARCQSVGVACATVVSEIYVKPSARAAEVLVPTLLLV